VVSRVNALLDCLDLTIFLGFENILGFENNCVKVNTDRPITLH